MAYLSTIDFFEDQNFLDRWRRTLKGDLDLSWMQAKTEKVSVAPENPRRGLTLRDLDTGSYGFTELPEFQRQNRSFAPRGAEGHVLRHGAARGAPPGLRRRLRRALPRA